MSERGVIELRGVSKKYGDKRVLDNISLLVPESKIYGFIGKSGCGKTTLLNIMIGFLTPTTGEVFYHGLNLKKVNKEVRKKYGFASQSYSFYPKLSVKENLIYFGKLYGLPRKQINERIDLLLNSFKLIGEEYTLGEALSSGMKKRLDIACAMIHDPSVLILDEPTADLDPSLRKEVLELIQKIKNSGTTIVITTHILGEIEFLCDKVFLLHNQKLKDMGSPEHFNKEYSKEVIFRLKSRAYSKLLGALKRCPVDIEKAKTDGKDAILTTKTPELLMKYIVSYADKYKDNVESISVAKPSLERLFGELTK